MAVLKYHDGVGWEPVVSALQGPTGASITGATGATGPTGATGVADINDAFVVNFMLGGM